MAGAGLVVRDFEDGSGPPMSIALSPRLMRATPTYESLGYLARSMYAPMSFILPVMLSAASWMMGGVPWLTDLSFTCLIMICLVMLVVELYRFPLRFGIGGLILYGGVLIWFGYDYITHWMGHGEIDENMMFTAELIAKAVFCHCLFVFMMTLGLQIPYHRHLTRLVHAIPEPYTPTFYLWLALGFLLVGLLPYMLFTAEPFWVSIWRDMTGGYTGGGAQWLVGRTGNVNFNWGAYAAILLQIGQIGGLLAVFYALLLTQSPVSRLLCWAIWGFWMALAFGSGSRGQVVYMALPAIALIYLKNQAYAAALLKRISFRAYLGAGVFALVALMVIQFQGYYRTIGFTSEEADITRVEVFQLRGTSMFSEGLLGYALIPEYEDFFYDRFPGEMIVRPLPQTLYWFAVGPVPRALWTTKPIDPVWEWYNTAFTGGRHGISGTTISQGLVGYWYFRYGISGIIQGGLLLGWLMLVAERALQTAQGRPLRILMTLAFATWLFRIFRGMNFNSLYPLLIGGVLVYLVIVALNNMRGGNRTGPAGR
ncbi:MAG: O-antigen polysaccharide polymerase Wzy [Phycisphaeraceae bacterium]|nr:O-antigen polysaccharide polymerase Wzy [Phycisphaeraceae bacterium]